MTALATDHELVSVTDAAVASLNIALANRIAG